MIKCDVCGADNARGCRLTGLRPPHRGSADVSDTASESKPLDLCDDCWAVAFDDTAEFIKEAIVAKRNQKAVADIDTMVDRVCPKPTRWDAACGEAEQEPDAAKPKEEATQDPPADPVSSPLLRRARQLIGQMHSGGWTWTEPGLWICEYEEMREKQKATKEPPCDCCCPTEPTAYTVKIEGLDIGDLLQCDEVAKSDRALIATWAANNFHCAPVYVGVYGVCGLTDEIIAAMKRERERQEDSADVMYSPAALLQKVRGLVWPILDGLPADLVALNKWQHDYDKMRERQAKVAEAGRRTPDVNDVRQVRGG